MNLAAKEFIESEPRYKEVIQKFRKLMNCLRSIKNKAKIRHSPENEKKFCALLPNETRWSGNNLMLRRFKELEDAIHSAYFLTYLVRCWMQTNLGITWFAQEFTSKSTGNVEIFLRKSQSLGFKFLPSSLSRIESTSEKEEMLTWWALKPKPTYYIVIHNYLFHFLDNP